MKELWFERMAMRGEPMPETLDFLDSCMYQSLACLYMRFFYKAITKEMGTNEKKQLYRKYEIARKEKGWDNAMYRWNAELRRQIERYQTAYQKNRTLENADALSAALDGRRLL